MRRILCYCSNHQRHRQWLAFYHTWIGELRELWCPLGYASFRLSLERLSGCIDAMIASFTEHDLPWLQSWWLRLEPPEKSLRMLTYIRVLIFTAGIGCLAVSRIFAYGYHDTAFGCFWGCCFDSAFHCLGVLHMCAHWERQ